MLHNDKPLFRAQNYILAQSVLPDSSNRGNEIDETVAGRVCSPETDQIGLVLA